jgi:RNA polymerase sigma-70 factor (ECF subfamily)
MQPTFVPSGAGADEGSTGVASETGGPPPFGPFFLDEYPRLVAMVHALSGDRGHAEDVAQEALLRAYRRWDVVGAYERPGTWARRVAINLATSARRRRRSEQRAVIRLAFRPEPVAPDPVGDPVVSADVWAVVRTLPRQQAAAIVLYYLADESVADLATSLGCAPGTAKAHLYQARAALAARLGTDPEEQP